MINKYFITFEGGEGSGKTLQVNILSQMLKEKGFDILTTKEPGGSKIGPKIREILLHPEFSPGPEAELMLFLADRAEHLKEKIRPHTDNEGICLCDRYHDSTIAYQIYGRELSHLDSHVRNFYESLCDIPGRTYLLDVPVEIGLLRARNRNNNVSSKETRIDDEDISFHKKTREGFLKLAKDYPDRIKVIDASKDAKTISKEIQEDFLEYLDSKGILLD